MSAYRIMLVDDHEVVRSGYRRFIESDPGLQVSDEAASATDAYARLQAAEAGVGLPDLLVVDISLGERSGLDLIDRCKRRFPRLRILVFSMHEDPVLVEHALAAGASGYVSKSSPPDTVLTAIDAMRHAQRFIDPALQARVDAQRMQEHRFDHLTRRELEVLSQMMRGADPDAVAGALSLSPKTVSNHLSSIRTKLQVANDFQLMRLVAQQRIPTL